MPSIQYMNQSAPFWDFIASLERQGSQHSYFAQNNNQAEQGHERNNEHEQHNGSQDFGPWEWGNFFGGPRGMAFRRPPQNNEDEDTAKKSKDKEDDNEKSKDDNNGEGTSDISEEEFRSRGHCGGRRGRCGGRGGPSMWGGAGGPCGRGGSGPRHGPPRHGPRGHGGLWGRGWGGPWGRSGFGGRFDPADVAAHFWSQFNENSGINKDNKNEDHIPHADVFDAEAAFVVHVSVPGAKKEDIGVNWDAEKSELSVAGVIYRPGDEGFLKTLAMSERSVGPFEKKIRLGTRANPAQIDVDGIVAKLEDGILRVEVPKLDAGYVEIKKVELE